MPKGQFRLAGNMSRLAKEIEKAVANNKEMRELIDMCSLDQAQEFQEESPVGATGDLRRGWDVIPSHKLPNFGSYLSFGIVNRADRSINRIGGREPGAMPPIEPIKAWAAAVLGDPDAAFPVAKKIARKGTNRYIAGDNWVGIDYRGEPIPGGKVDRYRDRLLKYINTQ